MSTELRKELSYKKTLLILSALCTVSAFCTFLFGELMFPITAAICASIFVIESKKAKICSIVLPIIVTIINVGVFLIFKSVYCFWGIFSLVFAIIIAHSFIRNMSKFDLSLILIALFSVITLIMLVISAMLSTGVYTITSVISYYKSIYLGIREEMSKALIDILPELYESVGNINITLTDAKDIVDKIVALSISCLAVLGFIVSGICLKIFSFVMLKCLDSSDEVKMWRFNPPTIYGHFFIILVFAYFFASYSEGALAMGIVNLYVIFLVIYAYVGLKIIVDKLSGKIKPYLIYVILFVACLLLSSLAIQLVAMFGAFYTTRRMPSSL